MTLQQIFTVLKHSLQEQSINHSLFDELVTIKVKALNAKEALGEPVDQDYPIIKGREKMIQATFRSSFGQAFTDEFKDGSFTIRQLIEHPLSTNCDRAHFISAFNAIWKYLGLCDKTIHCQNEELIQCSHTLLSQVPSESKVLLIGFQPRFLEVLAQRGQPTRVIDLDRDHIGFKKFGIDIEGPLQTQEAINWCDFVLVTGSTLINGTLPTFLDTGKPTLFYGVTIAAASTILKLNAYCAKGH